MIPRRRRRYLRNVCSFVHSLILLLILLINSMCPFWTSDGYTTRYVQYDTHDKSYTKRRQWMSRHDNSELALHDIKMTTLLLRIPTKISLAKIYWQRSNIILDGDTSVWNLHCSKHMLPNIYNMKFYTKIVNSESHPPDRNFNVFFETIRWT